MTTLDEIRQAQRFLGAAQYWTLERACKSQRAPERAVECLQAMFKVLREYLDCREAIVLYHAHEKTTQRLSCPRCGRDSIFAQANQSGICDLCAAREDLGIPHELLGAP